MKKSLALFLGSSILLFNLSFVSIAKTDDPVADEVTQSTNGKVQKKAVKSKNGKDTIVVEKRYLREYYALKNVVNHPFKICLRGIGWGFVGALIPLPGTGFIGFACGVASKAIELYEHGYEKAPV